MKILMANDDGMFAVGISVLANALSKAGHEVYIVAPDQERSAAGHSLTLHTPLRVNEIKPLYGAKRCWTTNGTPGDCVKLALNAILGEDELPNIVITGINHGPNLGSDIIYSGTVSSAVEGAVMGYPSIAVSMCDEEYREENFYYSANFMIKFLKKLKDINFPKRTILNINIPGCDDEKISGVVVTSLGSKTYTNEYEKRIDPRGKAYYWMAGELVKEGKNDRTDVNAIRWNKVSITPITYDMTNRGVISSMETAFCPNGECDWN